MLGWPCDPFSELQPSHPALGLKLRNLIPVLLSCLVGSASFAPGKLRRTQSAERLPLRSDVGSQLMWYEPLFYTLGLSFLLHEICY